MRILDLYAGLGGERRRVEIEARGHEYVTLDYDKRFGCSITADIFEVSAESLGHFDFVWASPPCEAFSVAAIGHHWGGGVLEHPADSHAWDFFGLNRPPRSGGWIKADDFGGFTCCVEQGHYGHISRKVTWLYAVGTELPELKWGSSGQRIHPVALERYGYEKARRIGVMAMVGGRDKTKIRNATPPEFMDLLVGIAASANRCPSPTSMDKCSRCNGMGYFLIGSDECRCMLCNPPPSDRFRS